MKDRSLNDEESLDAGESAMVEARVVNVEAVAR